MFNRPRYYSYSSAGEFARQLAILELVWPVPLIFIGIRDIFDPVIVTIAVILALLPWLIRGLVFGYLTRPAFIGGALCLLVISAFIGVWVSYDAALSWPILLTLLGSISLFFGIINTSLSPRWIGYGLVVGASLFAFYFVGQYGHFYYPYELSRLAALGRITGSLLPNFVFFEPHPNAAAAFLESVFLLSIILAWRGRGAERVAWSLATLIIAYGLLISGSRGAWVGLAVALAIWGLLLIPGRNLRLAVGGLGLLGAGLSAYIIMQVAVIGSSVPVLTSTLHTAYSRLTLYRNSLYLLGDYPFTGIGLGDTFAWIYSYYQLLIRDQFLSYAHNLFLSVGLGFGLLGLAALFWLLGSFYWFVVRVESKGALSPRKLPLFRAAWLGFTASLVHGLTDAPQFVGSGWSMPMLFAVLGLAVALGQPVFMGRSETEGETAPARVNRWIWPAISVGLAVLVVGATLFWRPLLSAWYANLGAINQTRAELTPTLDNSAREAILQLAVNDFARALALNPTQPVANRRLGLIALERDNFDTAIAYLEQAYPQESNNQATLKALGFAYMWVGRLDQAELLLRRIDNQGELIEELNNWSGWRESQGQIELSGYASQMVQRLSGGS